MNALAEERISLEEALQEDEDYVPHEEIVRVTRKLIDEHREAYKALANA